jgi:hypothetical protein
MEDIAKYPDGVLVMSNKKISMYDTVEKELGCAPELQSLGESGRMVTKIFVHLRQMGGDSPQAEYTTSQCLVTSFEA